MSMEKFWQAIVDRDEEADGVFVYAVRSTRIYCRPTCPSRRPSRDRVEFFPSPAMAEAHGYRACRRCRPTQAPDTRPSDVVRRVCEAVRRHPDRRWDSSSLARAGGASIAEVQRGFRRLLGVAPRDYVAACRRRRFLETLQAGRSVTDAIYDAGYGSPSRVYGERGAFGMTPATYGRGGAGASIRWATVRTRLGRVLVAATERGLCFVAIGETDSELVSGLSDQFPNADVAGRPSRRLEPFLGAVARLAEGQRWSASLPLDIRGTAFQWRVWRALAGIPAGETRSYSDVAASIGEPHAARAVARACASNPAALVIPCHRVVGADGSPGGYRWGTAVKEELIARER